METLIIYAILTVIGCFFGHYYCTVDNKWTFAKEPETKIEYLKKLRAEYGIKMLKRGTKSRLVAKYYYINNYIKIMPDEEMEKPATLWYRFVFRLSIS